MKTRSSFVANSSSSSFIIGVKMPQGPNNEGMPKWCAEYINKMFKKIVGGENITNVEQLNNYFIETYGYRGQSLEELLQDDDYLNDQYNQYMVALDKGYTVCDVNVEYGDSREEFFGSLPNEDEGDGIYLIRSNC